MASLPSQASRRRSTPPEQASPNLAAESFVGATDSSSGSDAILLNNPVRLIASTSQTTSSSQPHPTKPSQPQIEEPRTCWVCQMDDTEDTPDNNIWRRPCPCSLTAHESCLLEWITDKETPVPGQIASNTKIVCPQCQSEIKIQRPRDYLVTAVGYIRVIARDLVYPTAIGGLVGCAYSGLLVYGLNTIQIIFGADEAQLLLGPTTYGIMAYEFKNSNAMARLVRQWLKGFTGAIRTFNPFFPRVASPANLKYFVGLPLIGPGLVLLRSRMADQTLSLLLPAYCLDQFYQNHSIFMSWPPTPGLAFTALPYLRTAYNTLYQHSFANVEKEWDQAVQRKPREGETAEQIAAHAADEERGEAVFEFQFVDEDGGNHDEQRRIGGNNRQAGHQAHEQGNQNQEPAPAQNVENPPAGGGAIEGGWEINGSIIDTVMGALFFPAISSMMGEILRVSLPGKWVGRGVGVRVSGKGLLKEKWGRSLVGGCLFVVLKDMVTLYCKWKKAKGMASRKVLDYPDKRR